MELLRSIFTVLGALFVSAAIPIVTELVSKNQSAQFTELVAEWNQVIFRVIYFISGILFLALARVLTANKS